MQGKTKMEVVESPEIGTGTERCASAPRAAADPPPQRAAAIWAKALSPREAGAYYALVLLVAILSAATAYLGRENYLSLLNVSNVLYQSSLTSIMAIAATVILITGNIDLSIGSVAALAGAIVIGTADAIGFFPSVGLAMLVAVVIGLLNGAIVLRLGVNAFIVTLGTMTAVRGIVLVYTGGQSLSVSTNAVLNYMSAFESGGLKVGLWILALALIVTIAGIVGIWNNRKAGQHLLPGPVFSLVFGVLLFVLVAYQGFSLELPKPVVYMIVITAVAWAIMRYTSVGRRLYAVGGNAEAARLSGINVVKYQISGFVLSSVAGGFAGILFACRLQSIEPGALQGSALTVIAAAILGGTSLFGGAGSVVRSVAGALLLYSLNNGFNILNLGANYQSLVEGTVVVVAASIYTIGNSSRQPGH